MGIAVESGSRSRGLSSRRTDDSKKDKDSGGKVRAAVHFAIARDRSEFSSDAPKLRAHALRPSAAPVAPFGRKGDLVENPTQAAARARQDFHAARGDPDQMEEDLRRAAMAKDVNEAYLSAYVYEAERTPYGQRVVGVKDQPNCLDFLVSRSTGDSPLSRQRMEGLSVAINSANRVPPGPGLPLSPPKRPTAEPFASAWAEVEQYASRPRVDRVLDLPPTAFDGYLMGSDGDFYDPTVTPLADIPAFLPKDGLIRENRPILHVNGIDTRPGDFEAEMEELADGTGAPTIGIYNAREDFLTDVGQAWNDRHNDAYNPASAQLTKILSAKLAAGEHVNVSGYSQGAAIVQHALADLQRGLVAAGNTQDAAERLMSNLDVETFAGAGINYPPGPRYVHNVNAADLVGSTLSLPPDDFEAYAGRGATVRYFYDRGRLDAGTMASVPVGPHLLNALLPHRLPWAVESARPAGADFEYSPQALDFATRTDAASLGLGGAYDGERYARALIAEAARRTATGDERLALSIGYSKVQGGPVDRAISRYFATDAGGRYAVQGANADDARSALTRALRLAYVQSPPSLDRDDVRVKTTRGLMSDAEVQAWKLALRRAGLPVP